MSHAKKITVILASALLGLGAAAAHASAATELAFTKNQDINWSHSQMQSRGYHKVGPKEEGIEYWLNARSGDCARVAISHHRVTDVSTARGSKCSSMDTARNGYDAHEHGSYGNGYHHNAPVSGPSERAEARYEQGYQDSLAGRSARHNDESYMQGFRNGKVAQHVNHQAPYGGYAQPSHHGAFVNVSDLVGARAGSGEQAMQNRGFENIDGAKGWHRSYTTWWNERANECVQVTTAEGRYTRLNVVDAAACN